MFYQVWLILAFLMSTKAFSVRIPKLNQFRKVCHHRCKMQSGDSFDISARTYQCVDFETLLKQVTNLTRTKLGCKFSSSRKAANAEEATLSYTMIYQLINEVHLLPLRRELNLDCFLDNLDSNIGLVERCDLVEVSEDFYNVEELRVFLSDNKGTLSLFQELAVNMELPPTLLSAFDGTFDTDGQLSISKYPTIRKLRNDIDVLQRSILGTLQALLQAPSMTGKLTDTSYVEVEGRYCLSVLNTHRRGLGIVHGASNSGRTVYVEPAAVVEATNQLRQARAQLREEEGRICTALCQVVFEHRHDVRRSVAAVAELDVLAAKVRLGEKLGGIIPEVGEEGVVHCQAARHPLLVLREKERALTNPAQAHSLSSQRLRGHALEQALQQRQEQQGIGTVIGNDLDLSAEQAALVISGPNAGGKTIVLKTVGLFALMVQHGIPLPAAPGARVDFFRHVLADIGDAQSVGADVSTFSGHLLACKAILDQVRRDQQHQHQQKQQSDSSSCLVLLDEVGTGTDPAQGSALAQAVLEDIVDAGAKVVTTTHYQRIKELAMTDKRFRIAAMEFKRGAPTYAMRVGSVGESFALAAARRLQFPEEVLVRADALLDDDSRRLVELQAHLQEEMEAARGRQQEYTQKLDELAVREDRVVAQNQEAAALIQQLRERHAEEFLVDLKAKEREMDHLLLRAHSLVTAKSFGKEAEASGRIDKAPVAEDHVATLQSMREAVKAERLSTERDVVSATASAKWKAVPLQPGQPVEVGAQLVVLEPGNMLQGSRGMVTHRNRGKGRVVLRVAGVEMKMERHLLGVPFSTRGAIPSTTTSTDSAREREEAMATDSSREARLLRIVAEELVHPGDLARKPRQERAIEVRKVDLKSCKALIDAQQLCSMELDAVRHCVGKDVGKHALHIVHGVNCPYKERLRAWLRTQASTAMVVKAAELSAGGDAVTVVEAAR